MNAITIRPSDFTKEQVERVMAQKKINTAAKAITLMLDKYNYYADTCIALDRVVSEKEKEIHELKITLRVLMGIEVENVVSDTRKLGLT